MTLHRPLTLATSHEVRLRPELNEKDRCRESVELLKALHQEESPVQRVPFLHRSVAFLPNPTRRHLWLQLSFP